MPRDGVVTLSAATDATNSFLLPTFLKVIVLDNFDFFFFFSTNCESRAKNIITRRVTSGERGLATGSNDGVP